MKKIKWALDPTHSEIHFKVKHLMISTVTGQFDKFEATVETTGENLSTAIVHFKADIDSITTNNDQRDGHLKTGDFFDVENHPQLIFEGTKLEKANEENYKLHGTLTMRGVSKAVVLDAEFGGKTVDPWGFTRIGFSVTGKINRKDFKVGAELPDMVASDMVTINANVEFVLN